MRVSGGKIRLAVASLVISFTLYFLYFVATVVLAGIAEIGKANRQSHRNRDRLPLCRHSRALGGHLYYHALFFGSNQNFIRISSLMGYIARNRTSCRVVNVLNREDPARRFRRDEPSMI
jgi:hypothetical protein